MLSKSRNDSIKWLARIGTLAAVCLEFIVAACSPDAFKSNESRVVESEARGTGKTEEPIAQVIEKQVTEETAAQDQQNISIDEIDNNLENLIGQIITIRSEITATEDPNSFFLANDDLFSDENVLVINASGHTFILPAEGDMEVQVTGEVRQFVTNEVDNMGLPIVPENYSGYEQRPVIFASSITPSPDPDELIANPSEFYGETLAVEGEVVEVVDAYTFTLSEPGLFEGTRMLVLDASPENVLEPGEAVVVTGELRPFTVSELKRDYDLMWDLDVQRELEAEYQEKPVFVAREVYSSDD